MIRTAAVLLAVALPAQANADAVADWYAIAQAAREAVPPATDPIVEQANALVALAMYDAITAIEGGYKPYLGALVTPPAASAEAAAATAAHHVLVRLFPGDRARFDQAYDAALARLPDDAASRGIEVGLAAADRLLAARLGDRPMVESRYRPITAPGRFVPPQLPAREWLARLRPFVLREPDAFRLPGPPALQSRKAARDYAEVKALGARASRERTPEQTAVARFWHSNYLGQLLPSLFARPGRTLIANSRLFALYAVAEFDMAIVLVREKYRHNFWRPVTAIRNGDRDGNKATQRDPAWEPLLTTPAHPDYPCGHCLVGALTATIMASEFGDAPTGGVVINAGPGPGTAIRRYVSFSQLADEVSNSRVWGGVHFRTGVVDGAALGRRIAASVAAAFAPTPRPAVSSSTSTPTAAAGRPLPTARG
jgi:hypothetical protein